MKKPQKKIFTGYFKVFNEEVRIDSTISSTKPKCEKAIREYKSRLRKEGVTVAPKVKIKSLLVR